MCLTLCDPGDCSPLGSSVHGIFQARILEWVAISFSRGYSQPRDWTQVPGIAGRCFDLWATREGISWTNVVSKSITGLIHRHWKSLVPQINWKIVIKWCSFLRKIFQLIYMWTVDWRIPTENRILAIIWTWLPQNSYLLKEESVLIFVQKDHCNSLFLYCIPNGNFLLPFSCTIVFWMCESL